MWVKEQRNEQNDHRGKTDPFRAAGRHHGAFHDAAVGIRGKRLTINFNRYADAVSYADEFSGTLKLLSDVEAQYESLDDVPFITGAFTLDLNGESINEVGVGSVVISGEDIVKGTPGTLTVTASVGSGQIGDLTVNAGALTVEGGTTEHLYAQSYAATVDITGGTVTELALNEYEGEEVCAAVSGGLVQRVRMNGGTLTVDGGDYRERTNLLAVSGTADIVIKNGVLHNTFNTTKGGQCHRYEGRLADAGKGGRQQDRDAQVPGGR